MEFINKLIEKLPRQALVLTSTGFVFLVCVIANNLYAESDKVKKVAYEAKTATEKLKDDVTQIEAQVADVRSTQDTFRKEYREDQSEIRKTLQQLLLEIKK